jgi:hypothetical protein
MRHNLEKTMKKFIQSGTALAAVALLAGCVTTGLSPREQSGVSYPSYILSLASDGTNAPQMVVKPIRLAVAQVGEVAPPDAMLDKLAGQKVLVASVIGLPLPGDVSTGPVYNRYNRQDDTPEECAERIKSVRNLARVSGADYLFLFGGNIDSWERRNSMGILDLTVVGGVIAPGTRINLEGKGAGALVDVATGQPVLFVSAEAKDSTLSPDYLADGKTTGMRARIRDELVGKLSDELLKKLGGLNLPKGS